MYKKILAFAFAGFLALATSGCIKYSTSIEVTKKDEVILSQVGGISIKLLQTFDPEFSIDDPFKNWEKKENKDKERQYKRKGFKVKEYKDEHFVGDEVYKKFKKAKFFLAEDLPEGYLLANNTTSPVEIKKYPFGTVYSIHLKFDPRKLQQNNENPFLREKEEQPQTTPENAENAANPENSENPENPEAQAQQESTVDPMKKIMEEMLKQPEMQPYMDLSIKIPKKAKEHNATSVDRKSHTYKWVFSEMEDVKNNKPVEIILKYEKTNFVSIIFTLLMLISTFIIVSKNKQYSEKQTDENLEAF
ncbi:MAG: hypothetical protein IJ877_04000 [Candidatus Gastranaerophilales bacterium]|nr:hypothetical protein [Candidatus Gastranaerophilales bacterium]